MRTERLRQYIDKEMLHLKTALKVKATNLLVIITLLLSVFSFSGYSSQAAKLQQTTQTELQFSSHSKAKKTTIPFGRCFAFREYPQLILQKPYQDLFLFHYNTINKVKFDFCAVVFQKIRTAHRLYPIKTIPQDFKDRSFSSQIV